MYLSATQTDKFMIKMAFNLLGTGFLKNDKNFIISKEPGIFFHTKAF